ncbi:diacylglycerol/lipid kinase family protein [Glutamicibacter sp.]|uniref:diacylglycerol/lipid kinase family protein n=1 Tax=Glutamicibacter sp. TaxID=1931995 RepID=UPI002FE159DD
MRSTSVISIFMMTFEQGGKVRIVFHPLAGRGVGRQRAQDLASSLSAVGVDSELIDASYPIEKDHQRTPVGCRAIVVVGGDGLIHRTLPYIVGTRIPVGILPAGSGNDLWRMLGHHNRAETFERIVSYCRHGGKTTKVDVLELDFEDSVHSMKYAIGAVSWGAEAKINAAANKLPRQLGALRYIVGLLLSLPKLKSFYSTVSTETLTFEGHALAASIANIQTLGGGIRLFPKSNFMDGTVELSMVKGTRVLPVLPSLGKILRGDSHRWKVSQQLSSAHVNTQQASYSDGEYVGTGNFDVRVLPGAIELID